MHWSKCQVGGADEWLKSFYLDNIQELKQAIHKKQMAKILVEKHNHCFLNRILPCHG